MKKSVKVKDVVIGEGMPKICVPIVGVTKEEILAQAKSMHGIRVDVVEWRVDWFQEVTDLTSVKEVAKKVREELKNVPILFTFRTVKEGGEQDISTDYYMDLNKEIIKSGLFDLIDVELFTGEDLVKDLVKTAHANGVAVVMSNHEFHKTPPKDEMVGRLVEMQELGADLPKIAVMPQSKHDVLELLLATDEMYEKHADRPIITMSMGATGVVSRITGEVFGSALTFGAAKQASAPGQVAIEELNTILKLLHQITQ